MILVNLIHSEFSFLGRWPFRLLLHVVIQPLSSYFASAKFQSFLLVQFGSHLKDSCLDYDLECFHWFENHETSSHQNDRRLVWCLPPLMNDMNVLRKCRRNNKRGREGFVFTRLPDTRRVSPRPTSLCSLVKTWLLKN